MINKDFLNSLPENLSDLDRDSKITLLKLLEEAEYREKYHKIRTMFPDEGPLRRELYPKHVAFFKAGSEYLERVLFGGNRIGKTEAASCEVVYHVTGEYPEWWEGKRFDQPVTVWAIGKTNLVTRDVIQKKLLGRLGDFGAGALPRDTLPSKDATTSKAGVPKAVQDIFIKHKSGGISQIVLKSCDQGIDAFMGDAIDVIWFDEEPPHDVYVECLMRILTTKGIAFCTFTPLKGFSEVVNSFLPEKKFPKKNVVEGGDFLKWIERVSWDEVPHLDEKMQKALIGSMAPHEIESRTKGIPSVGAGKIYPVLESDFVIPPFELHPGWKRIYGLDVGWKKTAAIFAAYDEKNDVVYIYDEYYTGDVMPDVHAASLIRKGASWMPAMIDPASRITSQTDGKNLMELYSQLGLQLYPADNAVEAGIMNVYNRLASGRLKVMHNCQNFLNEYRSYARDDKGAIAGKRSGRAEDHLMDAMRYMIMGIFYAAPIPDPDDNDFVAISSSFSRNKTTGY